MQILVDLTIGQNAMNGPEAINLFRDGIADLLSCSGNLNFHTPDAVSGQVTVMSPMGPSEKEWRDIPTDGRPMWWRYYHVRLLITLNEEDQRSTDQGGQYGRKLAGDVLLLMSLARPGWYAAMNKGSVWVDGQHEFPVEATWNSLIHSRRLAEQLGWPTLSVLPFRKVWEWALTLPHFTSGIGTNRLGRALAAFSYLANAPEGSASPADLMWGMLGLEALYATGNYGLQSQLLDKSEILLGPRHAHKKRFRGLYDYRSRFAHGDLDIPLVYTPYTTQSTFGKDAADCEYLATAMLIASLQTLVIRGWTDLEFGYQIVEPPRGGE